MVCGVASSIKLESKPTQHVTCLAWIVFRARNMGDAWYVVSHLASNWNLSQLSTPQFLLRQFPVAAASIAVLEIGQLWHRKVAFPALVARFQMPARWAIYAGIVLAVLMFGVYRKTQFIYFQF